MVVASGCCGPAEAIAEFGKEYAGEGSQTGVLKSGTGIHDMVPVGVLLAGGCGVAPEKLLDFALFKRPQLPAFPVEPILVPGPGSIYPDKGSRCEVVDLRELWMIAPDFQGKVTGGVGEDELKIGRTCFGRSFGTVLNLGEEKGFLRGFTGILLELGDGRRVHGV